MILAKSLFVCLFFCKTLGIKGSVTRGGEWLCPGIHNSASLILSTVQFHRSKIISLETVSVRKSSAVYKKLFKSITSYTIISSTVSCWQWESCRLWAKVSAGAEKLKIDTYDSSNVVWCIVLCTACMWSCRLCRCHTYPAQRWTRAPCHSPLSENIHHDLLATVVLEINHCNPSLNSNDSSV